jgi:hypothetical protein
MKEVWKYSLPFGYNHNQMGQKSCQTIEKQSILSNIFLKTYLKVLETKNIILECSNFKNHLLNVNGS